MKKLVAWSSATAPPLTLVNPKPTPKVSSSRFGSGAFRVTPALTLKLIRLRSFGEPAPIRANPDSAPANQLYGGFSVQSTQDAAPPQQQPVCPPGQTCTPPPPVATPQPSGIRITLKVPEGEIMRERELPRFGA